MSLESRLLSSQSWYRDWYWDSRNRGDPVIETLARVTTHLWFRHHYFLFLFCFYKSKQVRLVRTFKNWMTTWPKKLFSLKSPHKSTLFRRESISKLHYWWVFRVCGAYAAQYYWITKYDIIFLIYYFPWYKLRHLSTMKLKPPGTPATNLAKVLFSYCQSPLPKAPPRRVCSPRGPVTPGEYMWIFCIQRSHLYSFVELYILDTCIPQ